MQLHVTDRHVKRTDASSRPVSASSQALVFTRDVGPTYSDIDIWSNLLALSLRLVLLRSRVHRIHRLLFEISWLWKQLTCSDDIIISLTLTWLSRRKTGSRRNLCRDWFVSGRAQLINWTNLAPTKVSPLSWVERSWRRRSATARCGEKCWSVLWQASEDDDDIFRIV